jgi:hypothetical protein
VAIQSILGGMWVPPVLSLDAAPSLTNLANMTNAAGKVAFILDPPKTGNVRKIVWGTRTVTTGATVDVRVETIDATVVPSTPSGTLWGTNTNASQVVANGDDNVVFATQLTADAAVTRGTPIAVVIANASPGSMLVPTVLAYPDRASAFPYGLSHNGTSWTANIGGYYPMVALEYDDGSHEPIVGVLPPSAATTSSTINTTTTPDVVGSLFQFAFPCRIGRAWIIANGGGDFTVKIVTTAYNQGAQTGVLATKTFDKDMRASVPYLYMAEFDQNVSISASTNYRLIVEPSTSTSIVLYRMSLQSLQQLNAIPGGANFCFTSAKDPTTNGDWTDLNSGSFAMFFGGVQVNGFDDGVSGGGGEHAYPFVG